MVSDDWLDQVMSEDIGHDKQRMNYRGIFGKIWWWGWENEKKKEVKDDSQISGFEQLANEAIYQGKVGWEKDEIWDKNQVTFCI